LILIITLNVQTTFSEYNRNYDDITIMLANYSLILDKDNGFDIGQAAAGGDNEEGAIR
jgi:hypothetical protein